MMDELVGGSRLPSVALPEDTRLHEEYLEVLQACILPGAKFERMKVVLDLSLIHI